ncbi:hypothetical protein PpBr36_08362 [Pyricularia pennisetigena]|uniref:hypothetical protein n=1 Tax=Pyricularia pennisetigena TaxID=1578925 RepID=UPI001150625B|nr:hypothetical protein PpBr36_08362 [Pyricularia pennisetigena]TLS23944.1 hypothetical protein PpBr36_08362 [Pyricularia pennisetigena]
MAALTMHDCDINSCPVPSGFVNTTPHLPGNAVLLASFAMAIPINVYFGVRHETPLYTLLLVAGILLEIIGHIGNILLRDNLASRPFFTMYMVGSITGPTFIAAAVYAVLPHILSVYGTRFCEIPSPLWLGLLFFGFDVFTLAFQIVGCVFTVDGIARPEMSQGVNILLAGLAIQVASLLLYFGVYYGFVSRISRHRNRLEEKHSHIYLSQRFRIFLVCLQSAAALILVRTIARIVQISGGIASDLFQSQTLSLVLDSAMILLACIALTVIPPGVAFGTRAWNETAPHMIGFSTNGTYRSEGSRSVHNYSLQSHRGSSSPVQAPYHSTPYQPIMPLRGQQARGYADQVPAHYQFPNLHKSTTKPRPIRVAPYRPDDDDGISRAVGSAELMQPGSAGSQTSPLSNSQYGYDKQGSKRYSPRQSDMVKDEALW